LGFKIVSEIREYGVECPRSLTRGDHVHIEPRKRFRELAERRGKGRALLDVLTDFDHDTFERHVFGLLGERRQRADKGEPRADEGAELAGGDG